ncbi:putative signal transducing protein [Salinicola sp. V024]|uniref:putative signal transducing protein n=1 Tax=Salinicola sp. V024 TaxID=3459609 RepID=UPI0040446334
MSAGQVCVFRHSNVLLVSHVRNVIESAGLSATLRNMTLAGGAGELLPDQCEAEVWVAIEAEWQAGQLVREALDGPSVTAPTWRCAGCGERLDGVFDRCWQCGHERPTEFASI